MKFLLTLLLLSALSWQNLHAEFLDAIWLKTKSGHYDELGLRFQVGKELTLMLGSKWCLVRGKLRELESAPVARGNRIDIPNDLRRVLKQEGFLTQKQVAKSSDWPIVTLDAGHGGHDPGAIGLGGLREKDVALDIAIRVRRYLSKKRVTVHMTRTKDEFIGLHERCNMSNSWKSTVFVSIHLNANAVRETEGYQIYEMSPTISCMSRASALKGKVKLPKHRPTLAVNLPKSVSTLVSLFSWKDTESSSLAKHMQKAFRNRKAARNFLLKRNFCVLRETLAPAVLVESEFISNPKVEVFMEMAHWRDQLARQIAEGILSYLGLGPIS